LLASILKNAKSKYRDALNRLIEIICDELALHHWKEHCLSHVYRALVALYDFAQDDKERTGLKTEQYRISILIDGFFKRL